MPCKKVKKDQSYALINVNKVLKEWYDSRNNEVQLDGSTEYNNNRSAWINFIYKKEYYQINGDTRDTAVEEFLKLYESNNGEFEKILISSTTTQGGECLKLSSSTDSADGWYCYKSK